VDTVAQIGGKPVENFLARAGNADRRPLRVQGTDDTTADRAGGACD
jgi:hypothetical protein